MQHNVTTLQLPKSKINKLQNTGHNYCEELNTTLLSSLEIYLPAPPVTKTGLELLEEELLNSCILTYNLELDEVIKDEIVSSKITELTGFPGSGKTQISFQICITVQLPMVLGGVEGEAVYISTNYNISSERIKDMATKFVKQANELNIKCDSFTADYILKHIHVFKCDDFGDLSAAIIYLEEYLKEKKVKVIVIDSISAPLRELDQQNRTTQMHYFLSNLQSLAVRFKLAIVITNDYTTRIKGAETCYTPSFGDSFYHRVNSRICLSKHNNVHYAEIVKSMTKPCLKVCYSMF